MKQAGSHTIITGGSSGIGLAMALQLARQGHRISIVGRCWNRLSQAQTAIENASDSSIGQVLAISADISQQEEAEQAIQSAIAQFGAPQLLITCAGMAYPGYFQQLSTEIFEQTMAINYFGTLYCIRAVLPAMTEQGRGQIALVSSGAGLIGIYGYSAYSSSKFALRGLAEVLRAELKPLGIKVAIAYPPDTNTPQLATENQIKPLPTQQMTATAKLWQPDQVARVIIQGLNRGEFEIAVGSELNILQKLNRLIKPLLNHYFDRIAARYLPTKQ